MRSSLVFSSLLTAVLAAEIDSCAEYDPCVCSEYSQISTALANCTEITLRDIVAPTNSSIDLLKAKENSVITFAGTTSFAFTNSSSFYPIYFGGKNVTITSAPGAIIDGNGSMYWDGLGSNGGVPK
jgi:polygalacturonase